METQREPYYLAYERRYRAAYEAGVARWGYAPDDASLTRALEHWVEENGLRGKRVVEFFCGEGGAGAILCRLGCLYVGVDIAPSAVEKARETLRAWPDAHVFCMDVTKETPQGHFDGALDAMGSHMLVTDADRAAYLRGATSCLSPGAPLLMYHVSCREDGFEGPVDSVEQWARMHGLDLETPEDREVVSEGKSVTVRVPILPARTRTEWGFREELRAAGIAVESFVHEAVGTDIAHSATLHCRKEFVKA